MSFSDPFNRVSRKREEQYLALREQLKKAGVDTEEKAEAMLKKSRQTMLGISAIVVLVTFVVTLVWPDLTGIAIVLGSLNLVWLLAIIARGQRMLKQYIQQELSAKQ